MNHSLRMFLVLLSASRAWFAQGLDRTESWSLHVAAAQEFERQGEILRAEAEFQLAASAAPQAGTGSAAFAHVLDATGVFYDDIGKFAEAESCLRRSLAIWRGLLGPEHFTIARVINRLADLYLETGQRRKAEQLDLELWIRRVEQSEPSGDDLVQLFEHLAELDSLRGEAVESEKLYRKVLDLTTQPGDSVSVDRAVALNNLGVACLRARDYAAAIRNLEPALRIWQQLRGREDRNIALTSHSLAVAYQSLGRFDEAEPLLKDSLSIAGRFFGPGSLRTANILETYARFLREQKRKAEAARMEARLRRIMQAAGHNLPWSQQVDISELQSSRHR